MRLCLGQGVPQVAHDSVIRILFTDPSIEWHVVVEEGLDEAEEAIFERRMHIKRLFILALTDRQDQIVADSEIISKSLNAM